MNNQLIEGVSVTSLKQIEDKRGAVFHVIKNDSDTFFEFGEAYFSKINRNVIKGWKYHKVMKQNFCVPYGRLKLVLYDNRQNSSTKGCINEFLLDDKENYKRITVPEEIWYSFKCLNEDYCLLLNIASIKHDKNESLQVDLKDNSIPYNW